jgi:hypothetical protein
VSEKLDKANQAVSDQWAKYDAALGRVPYVALLQIDRKLRRLQEEADRLSDEEHYGT